MVQRPVGEKRRRAHWGIVTLTVLLLATLLVTGTLFVKNAEQLGDSIQKERIRSVNEIGNMVVSKLEMLRNTYASLVANAAHSLSASAATSSEALRALFFEPENYFLIDRAGQMQDLIGNPILFNSASLLYPLQSDERASTFLTIPSKGEYWLFAHTLDGVWVDGQERIALVMMVSSAEYARVAAVPLYDGLGASYVVDSTGMMLLRPAAGHSETAFEGDHVLRSLERDGADPQGIEAIQSALLEGEYLESSVCINGIQWLIQLFPSDAAHSIVITIPASLTAAETLSHMRSSSLYSGVIVLALVALMALWMTFLFRRGRALEFVRVKAEAKSDFMSKVSHDIRTPLNAIIGMHQIALESINEQALVQGCLQKAKATGEYLVSLIDDVLDMNRIESDRMTLVDQPFSMEELLSSIHQMEGNFAAEKQIDFRICYDTPVGSDFVGDALRIRQCLMNLVSNAIKFTPVGGRVVLRYAERAQREATTQILLTVEDSGIGMSEDFLERIFIPFEQEYSSLTSEYRGSGLGLAIVHNLVSLMQGSIAVESVLQEGSVVRLTLPLLAVEKKAPPQPEGSSVALSALQGVRILLAEDHPLNRKIACKLMTKLGLVVDEAENGEAALQAFRAAPAGYYTLIFMDINMPVLSGLEAARAIRSTDCPDAKSIPIVALSANAYAEDTQRSLQAGMNAHLAKPIRMEDVKRLLLQAISGEGIKQGLL